MELIVYSILLIVLGAFAVTFGAAFFRGAPFAPTDRKAVATMIRLAEVKPGDRACDIGSGDGRLVIALAEAGAKAEGIERNFFLVLWSNQAIHKHGLAGKASVRRQNLWKTDFSPYSIITLFGIPYIMKGLEEKLQRELKPGSRVLSNRFSFPNWKPARKEDGVYLYIR